MKYTIRSVADLGHAIRQFRLAINMTKSDVAQAVPQSKMPFRVLRQGVLGARYNWFSSL